MNKTSEIFDLLLENDFVTYSDDHILPTMEEIKGVKYYKYHHIWTHSTNACWVFKNVIMDRIKRRMIETLKEVMMVNKTPFLVIGSVNMASIDMRTWLKNKHGHQENLERPW